VSERESKFTLTGAQLRAARGLLNLSAAELAEETKLGLRTIRRAEQIHGPVSMTPANADTIVSVLKARGVEFLSEDQKSVGVRLRLKPPPQFGK
jgi:transcriptional regulator with XRE-family HTH domain